ncbi:MAG TPA: hypothetical protein VHO48_03450, partial [Anaerolineaceae bacterium]|nr:hypothetical protein [Anaerolineaceae bacterium]
MSSTQLSMPQSKLIYRFRLVLALACLQGLACLAWIFSIPSDAGSGVFLGFSPARWGLVGFVLALTGLCAGLLLILRKKEFQDRLSGILQQTAFPGILVLICLFCLTVITEVLAYLYLVNTALEKSLSARLLPVVALLALVSIELILLAAGLALVRRVEWNAPLKVTLALWALLTAAGAAILATQFGMKPTTITWYEYGVPLASVQMLAVLGVALLGVGSMAIVQRVRSRRAAERPRSGWWLDLLLVLAIWAGAAAAWSAQPIKDSWLTPRPLPPNAEVYPNSDALLYDSTANGIWLGTDWAHNVDIHAKPFYTAFLVLLHAVASQDYEKIALIQTIFLGLFPVALYLLGKSLHSRVAGVCIALAAILREVNQLSLAQLTTLSTSKMLLSELPTALGIAVFLIVVVVWLKNPSRRLALAVLAGGVLGLLVQVRIQAIVFLPVLLVLVLIQLRSKWKAGLIFSGLVCLGFLVSVSPLLYRNWRVSGTLTLEKLGYLQRTLEFSYTPAGSTYGVDSKSPFATPTAKQTGNLLDWMTISGSHFAHNAVSTFLTVSSRLGPRGNWTTIQDLQALFWLKPPVPPSWPTALSYVLNLGLFSLGVAALWHRHRWLGLAPAIFYGVYSLSSAASGFSAQRFILPVDWIGY